MQFMTSRKINTYKYKSNEKMNKDNLIKDLSR